MDDQNKTTNPQQPPTPSQGGERVIQPTPSFVEEMKTQQASPQPAPISPEPQVSPPAPEPMVQAQPAIQPTVQPQTNIATPTVITGGEAPIGKPFTPLTNDDSKSKKHWLRLSLIALPIVIIVVAGLLLATNYNLRAPLLGSRFRQYTYTNSKGNTFRLLYYKGSSYKKNYSTTSIGFLQSPPQVSGGLPVIMSIDGFPDDVTAANRADVNENNSCSEEPHLVKAFSVNMKNFNNQTANFCTISSGTFGSFSGGTYVSVFGNDTTAYSITISTEINLNDLTNASYLKSLTQKFNESNPTKADITTIVSSIKYLHSK